MTHDDPLDIERPDRLIQYLRTAGHIAPDETPRVSVLTGGVSNRTVLVERADGEAWVLKQALAKLRVKVDWFSDPARVHREALGLRYLEALAPRGAIAPLVFEDRHHHLLAMRAVPQPHENWKTMLMAGRVERDHVAQFARLLAAIHRGAFERRDELSRVFDDRSYFESLRVEPYYLYTASRIPASSAFYESLVADTRSRRLTLVHGDYSPKNILVHEGQLVLLDHEVIHWGDPAFDLGFAMTHLLSKAHHVAAHREQFADASQRFWETYSEALGDVPWGRDLEMHAVRHSLGCILARVAGRSPLEYLGERERVGQRDAVVEMMGSAPGVVSELVDEFLARVT